MIKIEKEQAKRIYRLTTISDYQKFDIIRHDYTNYDQLAKNMKSDDYLELTKKICIKIVSIIPALKKVAMLYAKEKINLYNSNLI
tara:strand:- start:3021 stop:3275 length:255 start_codon:yes stop_codon:yes gene_type:complete